VLADEFIDLVNVNYSLKDIIVTHTVTLVNDCQQMFQEFWLFLPKILCNALETDKTLGFNSEYKETLLYRNGWKFEQDIESEIL